jgi:hypothetical protein
MLLIFEISLTDPVAMECYIFNHRRRYTAYCLTGKVWSICNLKDISRAESFSCDTTHIITVCVRIRYAMGLRSTELCMLKQLLPTQCVNFMNDEHAHSQLPHNYYTSFGNLGYSFKERFI